MAHAAGPGEGQQAHESSPTPSPTPSHAPSHASDEPHGPPGPSAASIPTSLAEEAARAATLAKAGWTDAEALEDAEEDVLVVTDNRTGREIRVPISADGVVAATHFKQLRLGEDDHGRCPSPPLPPGKLD